MPRRGRGRCGGGLQADYYMHEVPYCPLLTQPCASLLRPTACARHLVAAFASHCSHRWPLARRRAKGADEGNERCTLSRRHWAHMLPLLAGRWGLAGAGSTLQGRMHARGMTAPSLRGLPPPFYSNPIRLGLHPRRPPAARRSFHANTLLAQLACQPRRPVGLPYRTRGGNVFVAPPTSACTSAAACGPAAAADGDGASLEACQSWQAFGRNTHAHARAVHTHTHTHTHARCALQEPDQGWARCLVVALSTRQSCTRSLRLIGWAHSTPHTSVKSVFLGAMGQLQPCSARLVCASYTARAARCVRSLAVKLAPWR